MCSLSFVQIVCVLERNVSYARIGGLYLDIPMFIFFFLTVSLVIGGWKTCAEPSNTIVCELAEN